MKNGWTRYLILHTTKKVCAQSTLHPTAISYTLLAKTSHFQSSRLGNSRASSPMHMTSQSTELLTSRTTTLLQQVMTMDWSSYGTWDSLKAASKSRVWWLWMNMRALFLILRTTTELKCYAHRQTMVWWESGTYVKANSMLWATVLRLIKTHFAWWRTEKRLLQQLATE